MTIGQSVRAVRARPRNGFTLIELLIVIAVIGVLMALSVVLAGRVMEGGRRGLTENVIRVLDQVYASYAADRQGKFAKIFTDETGTQFPIFDGRAPDLRLPDPPASPPLEEMPGLPSTTFFLLVIEQSMPVGTQLSGIDPKLIKRGSIIAAPLASTPGNKLVRVKQTKVDTNQLPTPDDPDRQPNDLQGLAIQDAWGRPIRFVHPAFSGGYGEYFEPDKSSASTRGSLKLKDASAVEYVFRRSYRPFDPRAVPRAIGDADEGICPGGAPYFYSAGPDGDPGTRGDNVYSTRPTFPPETAKFNNF